MKRLFTCQTTPPPAARTLGAATDSTGFHVRTLSSGVRGIRQSCGPGGIRTHSDLILSQACLPVAPPSLVFWERTDAFAEEALVLPNALATNGEEATTSAGELLFRRIATGGVAAIVWIAFVESHGRRKVHLGSRPLGVAAHDDR